MNPVSDSFLLEVAGITASLLGFFVVGVFFYVQRGLFPRAAQVAQQYMQAATRTVIVLYGMTLSVSLGLVVFEPSWAALLYLGVSIVLLWAVVRTSLAISRLHRALEIRVIPQIPMWMAAVASLGVPWVLGGTSPSREQLTMAILLLGVFAFASSASLVLSTFDISRLESSAVPRYESQILTDHVEDFESLGVVTESHDGRKEDVRSLAGEGSEQDKSSGEPISGMLKRLNQPRIDPRIATHPTSGEAGYADEAMRTSTSSSLTQSQDARSRREPIERPPNGDTKTQFRSFAAASDSAVDHAPPSLEWSADANAYLDRKVRSPTVCGPSALAAAPAIAEDGFMTTTADAVTGKIDLYWIPLGAGGSGFVRLNGRIYEAVKSRLERRRPSALYHTALQVHVPEGRFVIETMWPRPDLDTASRGVVVEGPVGGRWLARWRTFRYEVRRWRNGVLPDVDYAVGGPQKISDDAGQAQRLLELAESVPSLTWGRDQRLTGEMWNSNSVISWLLARSGLPMEEIRPPDGGRAPGWDAGVAIAAAQHLLDLGGGRRPG